MADPKLEASRVAEKWLSEQEPEHQFPVDCIRIAESLGIKVKGAPLPGDFQGALFLTSEVNAIIYNENIKEKGRKNFTVAHELGHFMLHQDKDEVKCKIEDMGQFTLTPHGKTLEKEANQFAASLLMPEKDISRYLTGVELDINLVLELAKRYETTATATACQMVNTSQTPLAVVLLNEDTSTQWCFRNPAFRDLFIKKGTKINIPSPPPQEPIDTDQDIWFPKQIDQKWALRVSSLDMEEYKQRLCLLSGKHAL